VVLRCVGYPPFLNGFFASLGLGTGGTVLVQSLHLFRECNRFFSVFSTCTSPPPASMADGIHITFLPPHRPPTPISPHSVICWKIFPSVFHFPPPWATTSHLILKYSKRNTRRRMSPETSLFSSSREQGDNSYQLCPLPLSPSTHADGLLR